MSKPDEIFAPALTGRTHPQREERDLVEKHLVISVTRRSSSQTHRLQDPNNGLQLSHSPGKISPSQVIRHSARGLLHAPTVYVAVDDM